MSLLSVPVATSTDAAATDDPHTAAAISPRGRLRRACWGLVCSLLFRYSPRPAHAWRVGVLRLFGAKLGTRCHIYPKAVIWAPWNLFCEDAVCIADGATVYNPAPIRLGAHCVVSQDAYLCGAGHNIDDPAFPMVSQPIHIGARAWICARATVCAGVTVGEGAVLALGAVATADLRPWTVHAGVPARAGRARQRTWKA